MNGVVALKYHDIALLSNIEANNLFIKKKKKTVSYLPCSTIGLFAIVDRSTYTWHGQNVTWRPPTYFPFISKAPSPIQRQNKFLTSLLLMADIQITGKTKLLRRYRHHTRYVTQCFEEGNPDFKKGDFAYSALFNE